MNLTPIEKELQRNKKLTRIDLESLRKWCNQQCHLPKLWDSDLAVFLHRDDYCIESAKKTLDNYFTMRTHLSEFFNDRDPVHNEDLRNIFQALTVIPLETRTPDGYKVILSRIIDSDLSKYDQCEAVKYLNMVLDISTYEEGTSEGYVFVFDLSGMTMKHCQALNPFSLKKLFDYINKGAPFRWKGLHYFNSSTNPNESVNNFINNNIVTTGRYGENIHFHSTMSSLDAVVPLKVLPHEMGGESESLATQHRRQLKKLESYYDWFVNTAPCFQVHENRRQGRRVTISELFGTENDFPLFESIIS